MERMVIKGLADRALLSRSQSGFALVLTVFVVALASILVMSFAQETFNYQRAVHNYTERIQADYVLKSSLNLAKVILELPKAEGVKEDWLGEPWALVAGAPPLPLEGLQGEIRLSIVDESGKINVNAVALDSNTAFGAYQGAAMMPAPAAGQEAGSASDPASFWKSSLRELFSAAGFVHEQYSKNQMRTLGGAGLDAAEQVAVIHDWIDPDGNSHTSPFFPGQGIETAAPNTWFYNRQFRTLSELAVVPGMTPERLARIAPFIRVGPPQSYRINVNTAPLEVLLAIGMPDAQAREVFQERTNLPINAEILQTLAAGDPQLARMTTVTSQEFSAYAQVRMASATRWARASINVQGGQGRRRAFINSIEIM